MPIPDIETSRLRLVSLSKNCLGALFEGNLDDARRATDFFIESTSLLGEYWVGERLKMIHADPGQHEWLYRAMVRKDDNCMVGHISFHHKAPDPTFLEYSACGAELGYTVEPPYRRQGYAAESAAAMMAWARDRGAADFFLTIHPANEASQSLAEALNYEKIGEMPDDIDGMEYLYRSR